MSFLTDRIRVVVERPDVTIAHRLRRPPYGGSNQFLIALRGELRRRGYRVSDLVGRTTRATLVHAYLVDVEALRERIPAGSRVVHRIDGPIGVYRGTDDEVDRRIVAINHAVADATILQSRYSLDAHRRLGLEFSNPVVIPNAVDPSIFRPGPHRAPGRKLRLIATSWSDNPNKGGDTYRWLAEHVDRDRNELTFVGRTPVDLPGVTVVPPVGSEELAELLRTHDAYLAPSLHDPCSNAVLEALACGLPTIYARSGGHPELVGDAGFGFDHREEIPELLDRLRAEYDDRRSRIAIPSLSEVATHYLDVLGLPAEQSRNMGAEA
jgi:glycosyltransferase involved in cell wall biosynthesis